jgi:hypothetical protein
MNGILATHDEQVQSGLILQRLLELAEESSPMSPAGACVSEQFIGWIDCSQDDTFAGLALDELGDGQAN